MYDVGSPLNLSSYEHIVCVRVSARILELVTAPVRGPKPLYDMTP